MRALHLNHGLIDPFTTNSTGNYQNSTTLASGLSDFHKLTLTVLKTKGIPSRNYLQKL